jgi:hypothetical protein
MQGCIGSPNGCGQDGRRMTDARTWYEAGECHEFAIHPPISVFPT